MSGKNNLKNEEYINLPRKTNKAFHFVTQQKGSINKGLYKMRLNALQAPVINAEEKWANEFHQQQLNWPQYYQMSFNCTVDAKYDVGHMTTMADMPIYGEFI